MRRGGAILARCARPWARYTQPRATRERPPAMPPARKKATARGLATRRRRMSAVDRSVQMRGGPGMRQVHLAQEPHLDFFVQKTNCGAVHFGVTASMQRGGLAAALRAAWASPVDNPNTTPAQTTLNASARTIMVIPPAG